MTIYLDESGCTGFKFDAPYLNGGSSRFLVLGFVMVSDEGRSGLIRACRKAYSNNKKDFKKEELKGQSLKSSKADQVARLISKYVKKGDISIGYIAIKKDNANEGISRVNNLLYNYAVNLALSEFISKYEKVELIVDKRSMKIAAKYGLFDYLRTQINIEMESLVRLEFKQADSREYEGLQLADWIANFVWRRFENEQRDPYNLLYREFTIRKHLFMPQ